MKDDEYSTSEPVTVTHEKSTHIRSDSVMTKGGNIYGNEVIVNLIRLVM